MGREVEGFSFRLNESKQYCTRNYEKKCKFVEFGSFKHEAVIAIY